jgi:ParB family chromosome partitioning protein
LSLLRDLESSLSDSNENDEANVKIMHLALEFLIPGKYQPRRHIDDAILNELAASIKVQGIIQPLIVRKVAYGIYEIVAGERRWRAAAIAGLTHVPVIVRAIEDNVALAFSLIENIQRENLNPIEEAVSFSRFRDEFEMTHDEIAHMLGRSRASVSNTLRLLALDVRVIKMLEEKKIEMGHARALLTLDLEQQYRAAQIIMEKQMNVRSAEKLANSFKSLSEPRKERRGVEHHDKCESWAQELSLKFSMGVTVKLNEQGKGTVTFNVNSSAEMDCLLSINKKE